MPCRSAPAHSAHLPNERRRSYSMCHSRSCAVENPWPMNASHSDSAFMWGTPQASRIIVTGPRRPVMARVELTSGSEARSSRLVNAPGAICFRSFHG